MSVDFGNIRPMPSVGLGGSGGVAPSDGPKTFKDALVKPELGSGGGGSMKQIANSAMDWGRWGLGKAFNLGGTMLTALVTTTLMGKVGLDQDTQSSLAPQIVSTSMTVGQMLDDSVVSYLKPLESNPDKIFSDTGRVGQLSKMFIDVQSDTSGNVSDRQKAVLKQMDDLGDRAFKRVGTGEDGQPIYQKMTQDEYRAALLHGAHVVVPGGDTLEGFKSTVPGYVKGSVDDGRMDRSGSGKSSHYTTMKDGVVREQYGYDLPMDGIKGPKGGNGFGHLLIGKTSHGDTFFQLEGHGTKTWTQWALHGTDLFTHLNSLANVGPHGVIDMVEGKQTHIVIAPER